MRSRYLELNGNWEKPRASHYPVTLVVRSGKGPLRAGIEPTRQLAPMQCCQAVKQEVTRRQVSEVQWFPGAFVSSGPCLGSGSLEKTKKT
jgi:hypothetical protein